MIMSEWLEQVKPLTLKGQIKVPYTWSVGEVGSRFLVALRDEQKIIGNRCQGCQTVFVPPRMNCGKCFRRINDWVEVGPEGIVETYTVVRYAYPLQPADPPYAYALIKLDGSDVGFMHIIKADLDRLKKGVRVKACFAEKRTGQIKDIETFTIV
jgi:uncharacterized OB-fold protein